MHLNQGAISIVLSFCLVSPQAWIQPGCACSATRVQTGSTKVCTRIAKSIICYASKKHGRRNTYQLKIPSWITVCIIFRNEKSQSNNFSQKSSLQPNAFPCISNLVTMRKLKLDVINFEFELGCSAIHATKSCKKSKQVLLCNNYAWN